MAGACLPVTRTREPLLRRLNDMEDAGLEKFEVC